VDVINVQRTFHPATAPRHWHIRPIRVRPDIGQVSATVHPWTKERVLHEDRVLDVGGKCAISQSRQSIIAQDVSQDFDLYFSSFMHSPLFYFGEISNRPRDLTPAIGIGG
jgi:hypothetical protein